MPDHSTIQTIAAWLTGGCLALCPASGVGASFPGYPIPITHWGTDEGLAPGQVLTIHQTRDGYLWFGSTEGLMRFDGVRCTVFDTRNTPEMRANGVLALYEDEERRLWIGTSGGGLACRKPDGSFQFFGRQQGIENEQIKAMVEDAGGQLWVGTDGGGLFQFAEERFQPFAGNSNLPSPFIKSLVVAVQGGIWVGSNGRLCRVHDGVVETKVAELGFEPKETAALLTDPQGVVWTGGADGLFKLEQRRFTQVGWEERLLRVQSLCFGVDGRIWVGTVNGLARLDSAGLSRLTTDQGLSGNLISSVFRDREGSIWIGSDVPGVDQIRFNRFASLSTRQGLSHPIVTSICQDREGTFWIGTHQGVTHCPRHPLGAGQRALWQHLARRRARYRRPHGRGH